MFGFLKKSADPAAPEAAAEKLTWQTRLRSGLARTRDTLNTPVSELIRGKKIDDDLLEELETTLLMADCGVAATNHLLEGLAVPGFMNLEKGRCRLFC